MRVFLGGLLGGVVMFFWGFVFWTLLPFPREVIRPLPNDEPLVAALQERDLASGVYMWPYGASHDQAEMDKAAAQTRQGPVFRILFRREGVPWGMGGTMAVGFGHFVVSAWLAAALLCLASRGLPRFVQRYAFVVLTGLFAAVFITGSAPIWFHTPLNLVCLDFCYEVSCWLLAGLVLAAIVRHPPADATAAK